MEKFQKVSGITMITYTYTVSKNNPYYGKASRSQHTRNIGWLQATKFGWEYSSLLIDGRSVSLQRKFGFRNVVGYYRLVEQGKMVEALVMLLEVESREVL